MQARRPRSNSSLSAMNIRTVSRLLGIISILIGCSMFFCLPWASEILYGNWENERKGVFGLLYSTGVCFLLGAVLHYLGRGAKGRLFRKEALAVVGLSWIIATFLGALPFYLGGVQREENVPMSFCDALFESQSGFSTTGATVLGDVERADMIPRCTLFWRSMTHFLGGLGIMVLFVAILGQGSTGKAMVQAEMTGPKSMNQQARVRQTAWNVFSVYIGLNIVLILLLLLGGLGPFDAICHAFATIATGGFSTFNLSVGHFAANTQLNAAYLEWVFIVFMFLGGTNFLLMYVFVARGQKTLFYDREWKTYVFIILLISVLTGISGTLHGDFPFGPNSVLKTVRYSLFHVVSTITTTGFCVNEYEKWNSFSCGLTLMIMFFGGCVGSTAGGVKIIRFMIAWKVMKQAVEHAYHPNVVRVLKISGRPLDKAVIDRVLIHFLMLGMIIVASTVLLIAWEPNNRWGDTQEAVNAKLVDISSSVVATVNNVGPGLGVIGARENYGNFTETAKFFFVALMMLGRLEFYAVLVLFHPGFWKSHH